MTYDEVEHGIHVLSLAVMEKAKQTPWRRRPRGIEVAGQIASMTTEWLDSGMSLKAWCWAKGLCEEATPGLGG